MQNPIALAVKAIIANQLENATNFSSQDHWNSDSVREWWRIQTIAIIRKNVANSVDSLSFGSVFLEDWLLNHWKHILEDLPRTPLKKNEKLHFSRCLLGCLLGPFFGTKIVKIVPGAEVAPETAQTRPWRPKVTEKGAITPTKCWWYLHNSLFAFNKKRVWIAGWRLAGLG